MWHLPLALLESFQCCRYSGVVGIFRDHWIIKRSSNLSCAPYVIIQIRIFAQIYCVLNFSSKGINILAADKNLRPNIVTDFWYKEEVSCLLSDKLFYNGVNSVPFVSTKNTLISILEKYGCSVGVKLKSYILQYADVHTPAHFNILPKVHKWPLVGGPIAEVFDHPSLLVYWLHPHSIPSLSAFLFEGLLRSDLSHLTIAPDCFLVTADVSSLYTNIPIKDCITGITALITKLSRFVLTNNYFEAEGVLYQQQ